MNSRFHQSGKAWQRSSGYIDRIDCRGPTVSTLTGVLAIRPLLPGTGNKSMHPKIGIPYTSMCIKHVRQRSRARCYDSVIVFDQVPHQVGNLAT